MIKRGVRFSVYLIVAKFSQIIDPLIDAFERTQWKMNNGEVLTPLSRDQELESIEYNLLMGNDTAPGEVAQLNISKEWYERTSSFFLDPATWNALSNQCASEHAKTQLSFIKNLWKLHGEFSHYTPLGLISAVKILEKLKKNTLDAISYLYKDNKILNSEDGRILKKYFSSQLEAIDKSLNYLIESMFARWELAIFNEDFSNVDLTKKIIKDLGTIGLVPEVGLVRDRWQNIVLNPDIFAKFQYYIKKLNDNVINYNHSPDLKSIREKRLNHITALSIGNNLSVKKYKDEFSLKFRFIPQTLEKLIPNSPRHPAWLFKGYNLRHEYFKNRNLNRYFLDLTLAHSINDASPDFWKVMQENKRFIDEELKQIKIKTETGFWAILRSQANHMLSEWNDLLVNQNNYILTRQIKYLENLGKIAPPLNHLFGEPGLSVELKNKYVNLLQDGQTILKSVTDDNVVQKIKESLSSLESIVREENKLVDRKAKLEQLTLEFKFLVDTKIHSDDLFNSFFSQLKKLDQIEVVCFRSLNQNTFIQVNSLAKEILNSDIEFIFSESFTVLGRCLAIDRQLNPPAKGELDEHVKSFLQKLRLCMLKQYWHYYNDKNQKQEPEFEKILTSISEWFPIKTKEYCEIEVLFNELKQGHHPSLFMKEDDYLKLHIEIYNPEKHVIETKACQKNIEHECNTETKMLKEVDDEISSNLDKVSKKIDVLQTNFDAQFYNLMKKLNAKPQEVGNSVNQESLPKRNFS